MTVRSEVSEGMMKTDNTEFWQLIVQTAMQRFRREVRLIYPRLTRDPGQVVVWHFTLGMILNVWVYLVLSRIIIRKLFFDIQLLSDIFTLCLVV